MLTPEVMARLDALSRSDAPPAKPVVSERSPLLLPPEPLEGREERGESGVCWRVDYQVRRLWPDADAMLARWQERFAGDASEGEHVELQALRRSLPRRTVLLDLETCGLGSSMVFLAGLLHDEGGGELTLTQLLARDYSEERAVLAGLWRICAGRRVLVTFNGKSFDWPVVQDRSTLHRLGRRDPQRTSAAAPRSPGDARPELLHCDLLHHCRRRWKRTLPDCRLQTLETYVCGRRRSGDVPGRLIPHVYHEYVRRGDPSQLRGVLRHNALDLITLLQLAVTL